MGLEIVISADGDRAAFPAVRRIVAAAPKIPGWKVTAFRPRAQGAAVELQGVRLDPRTVRFVETRIAEIEIVEDKRVPQGARPLAELAVVVDALKH